MSHKHITPEQQNEIAVLRRAGVLQKDIAKILGKTPSAISQELARNKDADDTYHARHAKEKTKKRRAVANQRFRKIENDKGLRKYIIKRLKNHWSPEQISGRSKLENKVKIGKDCIYIWISLVSR